MKKVLLGLTLFSVILLAIFVSASSKIISYPDSAGGTSGAYFAGNDYYIYINGDDALVVRYSSGKVIFVQREPYVSGQPNDYMEDFLTVYLNKFPSDLNF